jgi:assimilatory nitrate reductase catalytic subunit
VLKVCISPGQREGSLFAPIHWTGETSSSARIGELVSPDNDPFSGQPESKATPAAITPVKFGLRGFVLTRTARPMPAQTWWAKVAVNGGIGYLFATDQPLASWQDYARGLFPADVDIADYVDEPRGIYRVAAFRDGHLDGCVFVGPADDAPQWNAIVGLFGADALADVERRVFLSGRSAEGHAESGPLVCACFGVGLVAIRTAIASGQASNVEAIGTALRAGTNCGSCLPELKRIIADARINAPV